MAARFEPRGLGERAFPMPEPGGDDHGGGDALPAGARDDVRNGRRRRHDNDEVRRLRQILDPRDAGQAVDLAVLGIDEVDRPGKPASRRFRSTMRPSEPSRGLAPMSASERGSKSLSRR